MKKILAMLMAITLLLTLASCGEDTPATASSTPEPLVKVGEKITLGTYEQDNDTTNGKEAISWVVLEVKDNTMLLLSEKCIDTMRYHAEETTTWETSTMRGWLNDEFYNTAFTQQERDRMVATTLQNPDNPSFATAGGANTTDRIFLLSYDEFTTYNSQQTLTAPATTYALSQSVMVTGTDHHAMWWLRTPGESAQYASYVEGQQISFNGIQIDSSTFHVGVVPAMWVTIQ